VDVVACLEGGLERVGVVAETDALARREVAGDVIDCDDRLRQDVLAEDAALATVIVREASDLTLRRDGDVLTEAELRAGEGGVHAGAAALEVVVRRRTLLVEVVEGDAV